MASANRQLIDTVALIDDDEVHLMLYERIIKRSGMVNNLLQFNGAEKALEHLQNENAHRIDVIFLDINMPRMDGFEFLQAATESLGHYFTNAVVVMLTTSLDPRDRRKAESYNVVKAFINKPLTEEAIGDIAKIIL